MAFNAPFPRLMLQIITDVEIEYAGLQLPMFELDMEIGVGSFMEMEFNLPMPVLSITMLRHGASHSLQMPMVAPAPQFNLYATTNPRSGDRVIYDEDPDV